MVFRKSVLQYGWIFIFPVISYATVQMYVDSVCHVGIEQVNVKARCLDVNIVGANTDTLIMKAAHLSDRIMVKSLLKGKVLEVWVELINFPFAFGCSGEIWFHLPADVIIDAKTTSGQVSIEGMENTNLELLSASGGMHISNCLGSIKASTASGKIAIKNCKGRQKLKSVSGVLHIENFQGPVITSSVSGAQSLENIKGNLETESVSGTLTIQSLYGRIQCKSISGAIHGSEIIARNNCHFKSASGAINIDFINPLKDFSFHLESVSGNLTIGDTKGKKRFDKGKGEIIITAKTISGSQVFR